MKGGQGGAICYAPATLTVVFRDSSLTNLHKFVNRSSSSFVRTISQKGSLILFPGKMYCHRIRSCEAEHIMIYSITVQLHSVLQEAQNQAIRHTLWCKVTITDCLSC